MDNARKKYVNIERLSSGDIFAFIESFESVDEGNIKNVMTYSDTEFVAEDESVISTYIIRKEKIGDQSSSVSFPEASMYFQLVFQSVAFSCHSAYSQSVNQPPSPATQRTSNQSPAAATQRTADQSPAAVVITHTSDQSSKSTPPPPTVTIPKKKQETEAKLDDQRLNTPSDENNTNQKKGSVPQDEGKTKKKKTNTTEEWK